MNRMSSSSQPGRLLQSRTTMNDDSFWTAWLIVLLEMHENACVTYSEFMVIVMEQWRDACIVNDQARIISRVLWMW